MSNVTLLESAEKTGGEFIEKPAATVAAIQAHWVSEAVSRYQARHGKKLPVKFQSNSPDNTGLIRIVSESSVENAELLKNMHQALVDNVIRHIITNTIDEVVNLDKLTYAGNLESLAEVSHNERYTFEQADICNRPEVDRILTQHQPYAIMHLAKTCAMP